MLCHEKRQSKKGENIPNTHKTTTLDKMKRIWLVGKDLPTNERGLSFPWTSPSKSYGISFGENCGKKVMVSVIFYTAPFSHPVHSAQSTDLY